jgi:hypothetical protein
MGAFDCAGHVTYPAPAASVVLSAITTIRQTGNLVAGVTVKA